MQEAAGIVLGQFGIYLPVYGAEAAFLVGLDFAGKVRFNSSIGDENIVGPSLFDNDRLILATGLEDKMLHFR